MQRVLVVAALTILVGAGAAAVALRLRPAAGPPGAGAGALKPVLQGLLVYPGYPGSGPGDGVGGFVVSIGWKDIQPSDGPLVTDRLDQAIALARHRHLRIKLRVDAGIQSPDWVKRLSGGGVRVDDTLDGVAGDAPLFWTDGFAAAYQALQVALAHRYDGVAEVAEVVASRCTTVWAEPFLRQARDPATVRALLAAGYSEAVDARCQQQEITAMQVWRHTRVGVAFNPYDAIGPGGAIATDPGFTSTMMRFCRQQLGAACVLENDSIQWPPLGGAYGAMYTTMRTLGAPISFQTEVPARVGDPVRTLLWAADQGANSVELSTRMPGVPLSTLVTAARGLYANPA